MYPYCVSKNDVSIHGWLILSEMFDSIHIVECSNVRAFVARGSCVQGVYAPNLFKNGLHRLLRALVAISGDDVLRASRVSVC